MAYVYTSGTTGVSKGGLVSHAHAYTYASREHQDRPRTGDRILVALPLFHLAGQGITFTVTLGAMAELCQQQPPRPDDADNPLQIAVMAPPASDVRGFSQRFGLQAAAVYGMSEIGELWVKPEDPADDHARVSQPAGGNLGAALLRRGSR